MEDQLKQIIRRLDNVEKQNNLIYKDRDILEDLSIRLGKVEDEIKYLKENVQKLNKNATQDLKDIKEAVEDLDKGGE